MNHDELLYNISNILSFDYYTYKQFFYLNIKYFQCTVTQTEQLYNIEQCFTTTPYVNELLSQSVVVHVFTELSIHLAITNVN